MSSLFLGKAIGQPVNRSQDQSEDQIVENETQAQAEQGGDRHFPEKHFEPRTETAEKRLFPDVICRSCLNILFPACMSAFFRHALQAAAGELRGFHQNRTGSIPPLFLPEKSGNGLLPP
jgi:hypothetical protein